MMAQHDQARRVELRISRNDTVGITAQRHDPHDYTFLLHRRPQRAQARPEPSFALGSAPQRSAATTDHLNHVNISPAGHGDADGISHCTFGLWRAVNGYDDK